MIDFYTCLTFLEEGQLIWIMAMDASTGSA